MSWIERPLNEMVGPFNVSQLGIDEAYLNISASTTQTLWLYELSTDCFQCPFRLATEMLEEGIITVQRISTRFPITFRLRTDGKQILVPVENDNFKFCDVNYDFREFGVYNLHASDAGGTNNCEVTVPGEPVNIYYPLLIAFFFYFCLFALIHSFSYFRSRSSNSNLPTSATDTSGLNNSNRSNNGNGMPNESQNEKNSSNVNGSPSNLPVSNQNQASRVNPPTPRLKQRLRSLDTFRGICITVMIFVNDGGASYYFFDHATWDGLYIADLVFPWFLWIMGVCIPIAIKSQAKRGTSRFDILSNITQRSIKLICFGLILNSRWGPIRFGDNANLRIPGILQRFGICYFVCATLVLFSMTINIAKPEASKLKAMIQDIGIIWISWAAVLLILLTHCLLTFFISLEGCPDGYLGPGGLHLFQQNATEEECIGGVAGYLDRLIFTSKHLYQYPTAKSTYNSGVYDPEGFLGTLTSILQVWLGVQTGVTMLVFPRAKSRLLRWGIWAVVTGVIGTILCGGQQTGWGIPLNKNLWSLSFVLVTSCFALILLCVLYVIIDIKHYWSGTPFFEPGLNSILLYIAHGVFNTSLPWHWAVGDMSTHFIRLCESLWGTSLWVLFAIWLNHKKLYWSV